MRVTNVVVLATIVVGEKLKTEAAQHDELSEKEKKEEMDKTW